jgi:hypothetical protein
MKNVYEVLRQKETDLARVQAEIEALRLVLPLLIKEELVPKAERIMPETGSPSDMTATVSPLDSKIVATSV